jgi:haloalkane dehalogenase
MGGEPADTQALVESYTSWIRNDTRIPKLFVRGVPGAILASPQALELVRGFHNQTEVTVYGPHYLQEVSPHAIGRALADWIPKLG